MPDFATDAAVAKVIDLLEDVAGVQRVYKGAPKSFSTQVSCWAGVGPLPEFNAGAGLIGHTARIYVEFSYALAGQEANAEQTLANFLDAFRLTFYEDPNLDEVWQGGRLELDVEGRPAYEIRGGIEGRVYPFFVVGEQYQPHPGL